jgi:hypothetical protein
VADATLSIGVVAELKDFEAQMAKMPGIGAKEARDMVTGIRRELKNAEKAAQSSAGTISKGFSGEFNKVSSAAAALAGQVGGPFAQIAGIANSTVRPIAEVAAGLGEVGIAGAAIAGVGLALGGVGEAAVKLAAGASDAAKGLKSLGVGIDAGAQADLDSYAKGQNELNIALDKLEVTLGKGIARELGEVDDELARGIGIVDKYVLRSQDANDNISLGEDLLNRFAHRLGFTNTAIDQAAAAAKHASEVQRSYNDAVVDLSEASKESTGALLLEVHAKDKAAELDREGAAAKYDAAKATTEWALQDMLATAAGVVQADKRKAAIIDEEMAQKASLEHAAKYWDDYSAQVHRDEHIVTDAVESETKKQKRATLEAAVAEATAFGQATANIAGNFASLEQSIVDGYQARVDAGEKLGRAQAQQGNEAIRNAEALQIAQAGITAAITAASGIASLQEAGVPAPIAVPLGVAEGVGLYASTVAGIRQHRPIDFTWRGQQVGAHQSMNTTGDSNNDGAIDAEDQAGAQLGGLGPNGGRGNTSRRRNGGSTSRVIVDVSPRAKRLTVTHDRQFGKRRLR